MPFGFGRNSVGSLGLSFPSDYWWQKRKRCHQLSTSMMIDGVHACVQRLILVGSKTLRIPFLLCGYHIMVGDQYPIPL